MILDQIISETEHNIKSNRCGKNVKVRDVAVKKIVKRKVSESRSWRNKRKINKALAIK